MPEAKLKPQANLSMILKINTRRTTGAQGYKFELLQRIFGGAASQYTGLPVRPPVCLFQLASGEVSLTILTPSIVGEY